jgi:hypothetical protein
LCSHFCVHARWRRGAPAGPPDAMPLAHPAASRLDHFTGLQSKRSGIRRLCGQSALWNTTRARAYGRLSGIDPGARRRRTRHSPDANGLARAYPRQRIETRPPTAGPCCAVWDPETMWPICRRRHAAAVTLPPPRRRRHAAAATPPPPRRRSRHSPDAIGLATCH